ncbi:MAG: hypothetical protein NZ873_01190 [Crenarchaeota archaeon]|nr:hypothetical protein [Thermoproteota archaeon]MDW8033806.1 hypothetical protein [Nitrososphaerota archaeon]
MDRLSILFLTGFMLIAIGFMIVFLASILWGNAAGGGALIVFIGPFPLAIGFGEYAPLLILIGLVIIVVMILITVISFRSWKLERKLEETD